MAETETTAVEEAPAQSAFYTMQTFLREKGQLTKQELHYNQPKVIFTTELSLLGTERIRREMDLHIEQRLPFKGDEQIDDGIHITLQNEKLYKKHLQREELPGEALTQIHLFDPAGGRKEKAVIRPFNPVGRWIGLEKEAWKEGKDDAGKYAVTESEEEAAKIVNGFTTINTPPGAPNKHYLQPYTRGPVMSRAGFLRMLGIGAKMVALDSMLSHMSLDLGLSKTFWEQLETATLGVPAEQLKRKIEDNFQVELVGPATGVKEVRLSNGKEYPTAEWDSPRLKSLIGVLSNLPPHFYLPRKIDNKEHKLRLVLANVPFRIFRNFVLSGEDRIPAGVCACSGAENQLVVFDKSYFGSTFLESDQVRAVGFHEITHALTILEIDKYVESVTKPLGIEELPQLRKAFASEIQIVSKGDKFMMPQPPGANFLEQMPGRPFVEIAPNTYIEKQRVEQLGLDFYLTGEGAKEQIIRVTPEWYVDKRDLDKYGKEFYERQYRDFLEKDKDWEEFGGEVKEKSYLGYGAKNFYEFFSVAADYYSKGRNNFVKTYERFLGRERAEKLYDGMKREIFRGKEY